MKPKKNTRKALDTRIREAKSRYGHVYSVDIGDVVYTYRPLTVGEYRIIFLGTADKCEREERVISTCLIDPPNIDLYADPYCSMGVFPSALCSYILMSSMLDTDIAWESYVGTRTDKLKRKRDSNGIPRVDDSVGVVICTIARAFPGVDVLQLGDLTTERMLDLFALAKFQLGDLGSEREERAPEQMPLGLSQSDKQQFKESAAAIHAKNELKRKWEEDKARLRELGRSVGPAVTQKDIGR